MRPSLARVRHGTEWSIYEYCTWDDEKTCAYVNESHQKRRKQTGSRTLKKLDVAQTTTDDAVAPPQKKAKKSAPRRFLLQIMLS